MSAGARSGAAGSGPKGATVQARATVLRRGCANTTMTPEVDITIEGAGWSSVRDLRAVADRAIALAAQEAGTTLPRSCEVSCLFCDDAAIQGLNAQWRGQDKPTNVLSFPAGGPASPDAHALLGDIVLAFETVQREAAHDGKRIEDHLSHLIVHGFLHLLGYDHETEDQAEVMESLEVRILSRLGVADPFERRFGAAEP